MIILPVANFQLYWHLQRVLNNTPEMNGNDSQPIKLSSSTFNQIAKKKMCEEKNLLKFLLFFV